MNSNQADRSENVIEQARSRFEQWRNGRSGKARIPDELWSMGMEVARQTGVNRAAHELHLDGGKLKRLLVAADAETSPGPRKRRATRFVELVAPATNTMPDECVVEFESPGGSKMRVHWKAPAPPHWEDLLRAWRDVER